MNLWFQISLCGLFLLAGACEDYDYPIPPVPDVPQIPRKEIDHSLIHILSEKCPESFIDDFQTKINQIRAKHSAREVDIDDEISDYSLRSSKFYAHNELVTIQTYKPPSARPRYKYKELAFRKAQLLSDEYASGDKLIATHEEILNSWMNKSTGLSASYEYNLYGEEPLEADAEKWDYFTQMIWRNTTDFGLACVTSLRNFTLDSNLGVENYLNQSTTKIVLNVVANFHYRGNHECQYRTNVLPPKDSKDKGHKELLFLLKKKKLLPTPACQSRDDFYHGMTKCPEKFTTELVGLINKMRIARGATELKVDRLNLGPFSQEYANLMAGQSHEIVGHEPNNVHGGDIVWSPNNDTLGQQQSITVRPSLFMIPIEKQEQDYRANLMTGTELDESVHDMYKDFTRVVWKNTKKIGLGCALAWLPGQNLTRPIVVANFYPFGNKPGHYKANVPSKTESANSEDDDDDDDDDENLSGPMNHGAVNGTSPVRPKIEEEEEELEVFE